MEFDVCTVGHVTRDILRGETPVPREQAGGAALYGAAVCSRLGLATAIVTRMAPQDEPLLAELRALGVAPLLRPSAATTTFETIYASDSHGREETPVAVADPFVAQDLAGIDTRAFLLDPLVDEDFAAFLTAARAGGALIALDAQGLVRKLAYAHSDRKLRRGLLEALKLVDVLKADLHEAALLTAQSRPFEAAEALADLGPMETIVTMGRRGAVLHAGGRARAIPAFTPKDVAGPTGCGDSFLAAYVTRRLEGAEPQESGTFAAALASLKIEERGPFTGSREDVETRRREGRVISPSVD